MNFRNCVRSLVPVYCTSVRLCFHLDVVRHQTTRAFYERTDSLLVYELYIYAVRYTVLSTDLRMFVTRDGLNSA